MYLLVNLLVYQWNVFLYLFVCISCIVTHWKILPGNFIGTFNLNKRCLLNALIWWQVNSKWHLNDEKLLGFSSTIISEKYLELNYYQYKGENIFILYEWKKKKTLIVLVAIQCEDWTIIVYVSAFSVICSNFYK